MPRAFPSAKQLRNTGYHKSTETNDKHNADSDLETRFLILMRGIFGAACNSGGKLCGAAVISPAGNFSRGNIVLCDAGSLGRAWVVFPFPRHSSLGSQLQSFQPGTWPDLPSPWVAVHRRLCKFVQLKYQNMLSISTPLITKKKRVGK